MKKGMRLSRRGFFKLLGLAALDLFLLGIGGMGYGKLMEPDSFNVETVRLKLPRLARSFSGLRLAQISDIGNRRLHTISHFILLDLCIDLRVAKLFVRLLVQCR